MICPVCGTRMHGNICENCGYSIKGEKSETTNDTIDEYDEKCGRNEMSTKYLGAILILFLPLVILALFLYLQKPDVKRNEVKIKEEVIEEMPNTEGELFQENLSPYGYSIEENDEKIDGELEIKKIDPKTDKEVEEGATYDLYNID